MTNQAVIEDLNRANDAALRVIARALIKSQVEHIEDFVKVMGEELSRYVDDFAQRTGDYDRAAALNIVADHLMKLDDVIENYDGLRGMTEKPNHIGVCRDGETYVITAEYVGGYEVLAAFAILSEAKAALRKVKRDYLAQLKDQRK